jgi:hypothetical protein
MVLCVSDFNAFGICMLCTVGEEAKELGRLFSAILKRIFRSVAAVYLW